MKRERKNLKGFTLVELIVVIAVIGVLAGILVPTMLGYVTKAKFASANAAAKSLYNAALLACRENDVVKPIPPGLYPAADTDGTLTQYIYRYCPQVEGSNWAVKIESDCPVGACYQKTTTDTFIGTYPHPNDGKTNGTLTQAIDFAITGSWDAASG